MPLPFQHLTSASQLTSETLSDIFSAARKMEEVIEKKGRIDLLQKKIIALLFYEASSRTMLSFQSAAQRLGAGMILAQGKQMSSLEKGESVEDTIRMVASYSDLIVMRHDEAGAADRAASVSAVPFINAGDGGNQHPTQSILDLYTIQKEMGTLEGLHVAVACDPKHSRTIRSLVTLMSLYRGTRITFIRPEQLKPHAELLTMLDERSVPYAETSDLLAATEADILYMNRLQEERFDDHSEFECLRRDFVLKKAMVERKDVLILDPLPRVDEIETGVDLLPNAAYFKQARNGVPVRMALLAMMLGKY